MATQVLSSMLRINRQRRLVLRRVLAPYGYVGCMHLIVLYARRQPGASQEEIACFYALDKGSVARDARRLEDMGHIRRETAPGNRRQYQLFLTPAGEGAAAGRPCAVYEGAGPAGAEYERTTRLLVDRETGLTLGQWLRYTHRETGEETEYVMICELFEVGPVALPTFSLL